MTDLEFYGQHATAEEKLIYFETLSESYKTLWRDEATKREVNLIEIQSLNDQLKEKQIIILMYKEQVENFLKISNQQAIEIERLKNETKE